jgi:hypothetical protein
MKKHIKFFSLPIVLGILAGLAISPMISLLTSKITSSYQNRLIVENMRVVDYYERSGNYYIKVIGTKIRNDCEPLISITGQDASTLAILKSIVFLEDVNNETQEIRPPYKREPGENDFGCWELNPSPRGDIVVFRVVSECSGELVLSEFALDITDKDDLMINKVDMQ